MAGPHPKALRERVVNAWKEGEGSFKDLSLRFMVGEASVSRWVSLERRTGSVAAKAMGGARRTCIVDAAGEAILSDVLTSFPDATLRELCAAYEADRGVKVSPQVMSATLRRLKYTVKKGSFARSVRSKMNAFKHGKRFRISSIHSKESD